MLKNRGLSQEEAELRLEKFGINSIREEKIEPWVKFFEGLFSPISIMLLLAALVSLYAGKTFDFYFIIILIALNFSISFWQEKKANNAISKLNKKLAIQVKVLREGVWEIIDAELIVPGDIIELDPGNIIPADIKIVEEKNFSVNESSLTGESLPKNKKVKDICYGGSYVSVGWAKAEIIATGEQTYFGKILCLVNKTHRKSILENDILHISKVLSVFSLIAVFILTIVLFANGKPPVEILILDLSLIIAGIPISLPTIMTLIISFGVLDLAKKKTIVRRLSTLEDLANINLLLSDKTGTLTKNEIIVEKVISYNGFTKDEVLIRASFTTHENDRNPINIAIREKVQDLKLDREHETLDFIPFDSERKRSTARVMFEGKEMSIRTGADQIIKAFCDLDESVSRKFDRDIIEAAKKGYRTVAVACKDYSSGKKRMTLCGILLFSDTPEEDAKKTIKFIRNNGIKIKMLTGDNIYIAERVAKELEIFGSVINKKMLAKDFESLTSKEFNSIGTFAEILPSDKLNLVQFAQANDKYIVAVTGDGINDLPALKAANVSIAVKNAVDALKSMADINLLGNGISVIQDSIIESRKIFSRLYTYSVYRISESIRIVTTITLLGIVYGIYPLTPIQLIILAILNDIPIISLAFNRVKVSTKPSKINAKARLCLSALFGLVGIVSSLLFFVLMKNIWKFDPSTIQTLFFLKLTLSGHMLIYVAHTMSRWYKYLPSKRVIVATFSTQIVATIFAWKGIFMSPVSIKSIIFVWVWAILWMQISEKMKDVHRKTIAKNA